MFRKDVKLYSAFFCLVLLLIILSLLWKINDDKKHINCQSSIYASPDHNLLIAQRNHLAELLNKKQQIIGRMKCEELNRTKVNKEETTDAGGWCPIASKTKHLGFDSALAAALASFFEGKTVASFGDGPGKYKDAVLSAGLVKTYAAYDGAPFCEETSEGRVHFLDLSIPQFGLPVYDWVLCLEVAEHVPKAFEEILLGNIVRHAREGVILSWARPGQYGYSHVNHQFPEYVISSMDKLGFELHQELTNQIRERTRQKNLQRNINVFLRKELRSAEELSYNA